MPFKRPLTTQDCITWQENKTKNPSNPKNPISGYKVEKDKIIYNEIEKKCKEILNKKPIEPNSPKSPSPKSPSPKSPSPKSPSPKSASPKSASPKSPSPKSASPKTSDTEISLFYPDLDDTYFQEKIHELYNLYSIENNKHVRTKKELEAISSKLCGNFEKTLYQYFVSNYISRNTPYNGILLYHGVGVGKTCSAITLAEGFLQMHKKHEEPKIWVIIPVSLKSGFMEQIFKITNLNDFEYLANQCTGDLYIKLLQLLKEYGKEKAQTKMKKLINSRYRFFTYETFADFIEKEYDNKNKIVEDKVIIIDEAHNIRSSSSTEEEKRIHRALVNVAQTGKDNKIIMLSATPMYNEPEDIFDLLQILALNDKRNILDDLNSLQFYNNNKINKKTINIIKTLSNNYISYIKGKNPFTFAIKLSGKDYLNQELNFLSKEPTKDIQNNPIPESNNWLSQIDDGIVISNLSKSQNDYLSNSDLSNPFNTLPIMNIVYDTDIGKKGFYTFFSELERTETSNVFTVRYNKKYADGLYPDKNNLGMYSGKFLNICNIIKKTKGIVVIYSNYIWNGILPMAICLEHMGFSREGSSNILKNPNIIKNPPKYHNIKTPKYCILTSDNSDIMGSTSIDSLIKVINSEDNVNGEKIKVILMTPVASEGLSFYNVREMHIIEPWYHFNKLMQVIGRGIRNCRHQTLPIEERNVTVFMHASYDNNDKETPDIHAYRIAANKYIQSKYIENVIMNNAIDCSLMKNINYFPKSIFELGDIDINTSQGKTIKYKYGDVEEKEPSCNYTTNSKTLQLFRKDKHAHFITYISKKIKDVIINKIDSNIYHVNINEILDEINFENNLIYQSIDSMIYPNKSIDGYMLFYHNNGIHIMKDDVKYYKKIKIFDTKNKENNKTVSKKKYNLMKIVNSEKGILQSIFDLYLFLTPNIFEEIVKSIIENKHNTDEINDFTIDCLYHSGILIKSSELSNVKSSTSSKYIGYIDIFNIEDLSGYIFQNNIYRNLVEYEKKTIMENRKYFIKFPENMQNEKQAWGIIIPTKKKNETITNVFKILSVGPGEKTGMSCSSYSIAQQKQLLDEFKNNKHSNNKNENCAQIALELMQNNRMTYYPLYKPRA